MIYAVLAGFLGALLVPWICRWAGSRAGQVIAFLPLGLTIYFTTLIGSISTTPLLFSNEWVPSLQINFTFYVDGLSLLFALLISGMGTLIIFYGSSYLEGHPLLSRFYAFLLIFMGSMLGLVLAGNILTLFIFWELTSISSYLLIGFEHRQTAARAAAFQALIVTGGGGLALMAGLIMLGQAGGSLELTDLLSQGELIRQNALYAPILILILLGAFTKSAQFPFHFWLPGAMAAPTPVSAYLHSATMVKAGVYLLARLSPILAGTDLWFYIVTTIGTITMLVGVWALFKTDLKQILAYSTISALGTLVMLLGLGTEDGIKAAMVFLIVHALYKGALFLVAGAVDHETGTRDITRLRGLGKVMPIIAGAAGLAALSMAGVPPWLGFIGKELIYEANLHAPMLANLLTGSAVAANMIMVAVAGIVGYHVFFGPVTETARRGHEAPLLMWTAPLLLAGLGLLTGLVPGLIAKPLITPAVQAVLAEPIETKLALWHGVNPALILSGVTLLGGWLIYMGRNWLRNGADRLMIFEKIGPKELYEQGLRGLDNLAAWQTRILQAGYLRYYVIIIVLTTIALVGSTLIVKYGLFINTDLSDVRPYELALAVVMLLAAWVAVTSSSRLAVVSALSVVGYGLTLNYILFGAPDLAMTQISIDTLTLILLVLILYRLPRFLSYTPKKDRRRDMVISLAAGALMTLLVLTVVNVPTDSKLTPYFAANSYDLAKGRNVVNVILVDFRGFDTLGEITVLTVAAAGVFALLRSGASDPKKDEAVDR